MGINPRNNLTIKYCLFNKVNSTRNGTKRRFIYNSQGIVFNVPGSWSFRNEVF